MEKEGRILNEKYAAVPWRKLTEEKKIQRDEKDSSRTG